MILTAVGETVCFKIIFGAILRYVIFTDMWKFRFHSFVFFDTQNTKKEYICRVYMSTINVYICQYICRNENKI